MPKNIYEKRFAYTVQAVAAIVLFGLIVAQALGYLENEPPVIVYGLLAGIALGVSKFEDYIKGGGKK